MLLRELVVVARELNGLTLRDLEAASGVSNPMISQIESGKVKDPSFRTIVALSRALNVPLRRFERCSDFTNGGEGGNTND